MRRQNKTNGLYPVKNAATLVNNSIDDFTALADLRGGVWVGNDGQILEFVGPFNVGIRTHVDILDDARVLDYRSIPDLAIVASMG